MPFLKWLNIPCLFLLTTAVVAPLLFNSFVITWPFNHFLFPVFFIYLNGSSVFCRHFLLCLYGTVVIGLVLAGRLKELKVVDILTGTVCIWYIHVWVYQLLGIYIIYICVCFHFLAVYYGIENSFQSLAPHVIQVSEITSLTILLCYPTSSQMQGHSFVFC